MITVKEILSSIENHAPFGLQEKYDNSGLLVGNPEMEVSKALLSLDCTEEIVDEAIEKKCNLIITHHPILFSGMMSLTGKTYIERVIIKAIKQEIALIAVHTNLDNVRNGVNDLIADKIGLGQRTVLAPLEDNLIKLSVFVPDNHADKVRSALWKAGAGAIGNYDECSFNLKGEGSFRPIQGSKPFSGIIGETSFEKETKIEVVLRKHTLSKVIASMYKSHPYEEIAYDIYPLLNKDQHAGAGLVGELPEPIDALDFMRNLKSVMKCGVIRYTALTGKKIKRVALCGGSGSFLFNQALKEKADVFITADYKYHQFFDAEGKIIIADIGHFESEQYTPEIFYGLLKKNFPNFAVHLSERITNPVNYL